MTHAGTADFANIISEPHRKSRREKAENELGFVFDPLRVMLLTLVILNISRVHQAFPFLAKLRPGLLLVLASAAYAYINSKSLTRANIMKWWPMRRMALMGFVTCASVAFGISLGNSASFILENFSKTILCSFLVALAIRHVRDLYMFVWALALSSGILSFLAIFVFKIQKSDYSLTARIDNFYTYDGNDICVVMLVGIAAVLLLLQVARGWQRSFLFLLLIGGGATIARSGSRGGFIGLVAFVLAALVLVNSIAASKKVLAVGCIIIAAMIFAPPGYFEQMATILDLGNDYNSFTPNGRKALIQRGVHYFGEYPIFGLGIDNFSKAECTFELSGLHPGAGGTRCGAPHNSYIEALSETGLVGFAVWCSMVLGGVWAMLKLRRRIPRWWARGARAERFLYACTTYFALGLIGFAVPAFFVSFAWMDILYFQVALMSGLYLSIAVYNARPTEMAPAYVPARRGPGWRVRQSAQRRLIAAPTSPRRLPGRR